MATDFEIERAIRQQANACRPKAETVAVIAAAAVELACCTTALQLREWADLWDQDEPIGGPLYLAARAARLAVQIEPSTSVDKARKMAACALSQGL